MGGDNDRGRAADPGWISSANLHFGRGGMRTEKANGKFLSYVCLLMDSLQEIWSGMQKHCKHTLTKT